MSTANSNSPDTFCPAGWQLPYSGTAGDYYDASKSWSYLFTQYGYGDNQDGATGIHSYPLDYVYEGRYDGNTGLLYNQKNSGVYWSSEILSVGNSSMLYSWVQTVQVSVGHGKSGYIALRCVSRY